MIDGEQLQNLEGEVIRDIEEFTGNDEADCKAEWLKARDTFLSTVEHSTSLGLLDLFRKHSWCDLWDGSKSALQHWKFCVVYNELHKRLSNV